LGAPPFSLKRSYLRAASLRFILLALGAALLASSMGADHQLGGKKTRETRRWGDATARMEGCARIVRDRAGVLVSSREHQRAACRVVVEGRGEQNTGRRGQQERRRIATSRKAVQRGCALCTEERWPLCWLVGNATSAGDDAIRVERSLEMLRHPAMLHQS